MTTTPTTTSTTTTSTLPLLALVVGVSLLATGLTPLLVGEPVGGDLPIHHSDVEAIMGALRAGDRQLWLMNLGAGHPAGLTAPLLPSLLVAITALGTGLSSGASLSLWLVLGLLGTPIAAARGARLAGLDRARALGVGAATALLTSTSPWGLGPASALYAGLLAQVVAGLVWPVALGATLGALRGTVAPGRAVVAVVVAAACHPMSALFVVAGGSVAVVSSWLTRSSAPTGPALGRVARLVVGGVIAGLPIVVPGLVGARHWGGFEQRVVGDRGDGDVVGLLLQGLLTDYERPPVLLIAAVTTVVLAVLLRASPLRPAVGFCLGTGVVAAFLVGIGPSLPDVVPWGRFLALLQLATAALAGLAPGLLGETFARRHQQRGVVVGVAVVVVAGFVVGGTGLVRHTSALAARPAAVDDAILAAERGALAPLLKLQPIPRLAALPLEAVSALELTRPFIDDGVPALFVLGGPAYQSSPLRGVTTHIEARHVRLLHVGAILSRDPAGAPTVTLTDAGPLCEGFEVSGHVDEDKGWQQAVQAHLAGPRAGVLVQRTDGVVVDAEARLRTDGVTLGSSQLTAKVNVDGGDALLVCKVGFHPWWRASIDDVTADVVVASPRFVAVVVPPGSHHITLRFIRPWWLWLLWLGLPLGIVIAGRSSWAVVIHD